MNLTKFEQSGFILELETGLRIAIDIGNYTSVEKLQNVPSVDYFIVSHIHADHFSPENIIALNPKHVVLASECAEELRQLNSDANLIEITNGDKLNLDGQITLEVFDVDHGPNAGSYKENYGFIFQILKESTVLYFAGDMFYPPQRAVNELEVDYALIPIGGYYTFGPQEALDFVSSFKSIKQIFPMHYHKTPETKQQFIDLAKTKFSVVEADSHSKQSL